MRRINLFIDPKCRGDFLLKQTPQLTIKESQCSEDKFKKEIFYAERTTVRRWRTKATNINMLTDICVEEDDFDYGYTQLRLWLARFEQLAIEEEVPHLLRYGAYVHNEMVTNLLRKFEVTDKAIVYLHRAMPIKYEFERPLEFETKLKPWLLD